MKAFPIHVAAAAGDLNALEQALAAAGANAAAEAEAFDLEGQTALTYAVKSASASSAVVQRLIDAGASIHRANDADQVLKSDALDMALRMGDVSKVGTLVKAGANLHFSNEGYTALLNGIHGRDVTADPRLLDFIRYLIDRGVDLNSVTKYSESALRVLSRLGRFDAVKLLLDAGADESQLAWTQLHRAIAFGELDEARRLLAEGADLEERDWWKRTAWIFAITTGNLDAVNLLRDAGADTGACGGWNAQPPLFYAIQMRNLPMLEWLLGIGALPMTTDKSGETALSAACEHEFPEGVDALLKAGADVNVHTGIYTALGGTHSPEIARRLLAAGANPADLTAEARRGLVGLPCRASVNYLDVSPAEFARGANRRWGRSNPEEMAEPFWTAMIKAGVNGWSATQAFPEVTVDNPVWCAQRFGQSITFLDDGRVIQVGGEHEDHYDPDFCIYNDVFVHDRGVITILGYPEAVFPPTDFHTATLLGRELLLIGSLAYQDQRQFGRTPLYALNVDTFEMRQVFATGTSPGWIHGHRAELQVDGKVLVQGGTIALEVEGKEEHVENDGRFVLDTRTWVWTRL